jgi:hypothetical protein
LERRDFDFKSVVAVVIEKLALLLFFADLFRFSVEFMPGSSSILLYRTRKKLFVNKDGFLKCNFLFAKSSL